MLIMMYCSYLSFNSRVKKIRSHFIHIPSRVVGAVSVKDIKTVLSYGWRTAIPFPPLKEYT